jgi:GntR family transcriptional regulator
MLSESGMELPDSPRMNTTDIVTSPTGGPIFKEVKRRMLAALAAGAWRPGEALPAEPRLAERFGISIGTLRKAIDELVAEHVLVRQQGRGTFVATHTRDRMLFLFFNVVRHDGVKEYPEVELLDFRKGRAADEEAARLQLPARAPVFGYRNVLRLRGTPVIVDDITVPAGLFAGLTAARLRERTNTIYHLYQHGFGLSVVRTAETVRAVAAPQDVADILEVPAGSPLLLVRRVAYTPDERPVEFRRSHVDTTHHEYQREPGL